MILGSLLARKKTFYFFIITLTLLIAFFLRYQQINKLHTMDADEKSWIMNGISLIKTKTPESWTIFWSIYDDYSFSHFGGNEILVVNPFLDHPPLFSLLSGGWTLISHQNPEQALDWSVIRFPMIGIALATILSTAYLSKLLFGKIAALFSLLSMTFLPSHLLSSTLVTPENLLSLNLVIALILTYLYLFRSIEKRLFIDLGLLMIISFFSPLLKLSGVVVGLTSFILLWAQKKHHAALLVATVTILSVLTFILYGWYYDFQLFTNIQLAHLSRPQSWWYFFTLFTKPDMGYYQINDPLFLVGLIGSLLPIFHSKTNRSQLFLTATWIAIMFILISVSPQELYGWYKFITFPLVGLGLGLIWKHFFNQKQAGAILIAPSLLALIENTQLLTEQSTELSTLLGKLLIVALLAPLLLFTVLPPWKNKPIYRTWVVLLFIVINLAAVYWSQLILLT